MKNILLASTALVAFAGAAAADGHTSITFSGAASAEYNSEVNGGFNTDADLDATMSADLDNGVSVSVTIAIDTNQANAGEATTGGNLTISGASGSLIFGTDVSSATFSAVGDTIAFGGGEDSIEGFIGSYTFGTTTLFISAPMVSTQVGLPSNTIEFGVTADVGGMTVGLGVDDGDYVGKVSGAVSGVSYTIAAGEVAGVDRWDVALSYPVGSLTIGYTVDSTANNPWEASAAYAEGALSGKVTYASASETFKVEGSYDLGNGVVVNAGYLGATSESYVGGTYDLGGGASAYASFVNSDTALFDSEIGAQDYHGGTTIGVKFAF